MTASAPAGRAGRPEPDSVIVARAPLGEILFSTRHADAVVGRLLPEIAADFPMFHLDGRPYAYAERPLPRSLTSGAEILDEEFLGAVTGDGRRRYRCSCWPVYDGGGAIVAAVAVTRDVTVRERREAGPGHRGGSEGETTGCLTLHRDISARERAQQALREAQRRSERAEAQRERGARRQGIVAELGLRALTGDDVQAVMDEAVALVAQTLDVELAEVAELAAGGGEAIVRAGVGWKDGVVGQRPGRDADDSLMGYTLRCRAAVISEDVAADGRFDAGSIARDHGVVSALSVTIATPDEPFGALAALSTSRRTFSAADVSFVQAVANVVGGAVERSRARERLSEVREGERRRLARDLHDEALQELAVALAEARRREFSAAEPGPDPIVPALRRVGEHLRGAIYDLRLKDQEQRVFADLLEAMVALHGAMAGDGRVELDMDGGVPSTALGRRGTEILRLAGEALTNARRHAQAASIRVCARGTGDRLCIEVIDDGRGFDAGAEPSAAAGTGITGMRERAELLGADLDITSRPGGGTTVRLDVPLGAGRQGEQCEVRVLLVEDHTAVRQAMAAMFEREPAFNVVGQAASLAQARRMLQDVDVAVVDPGLPDGYGGDLIQELAVVNPRAQVLVLSASLDRADTARAIESGAAGVLDKVAQLDEVVDAVRRLRAGETLIPLDEVLELLSFAHAQREREHEDRAAVESLTPREVEVLQMLAEGLDSQAIAARLDISVRTERNHVANILAKLGVHSRLQALVFGIRYRIVQVR